LNGKKNLQPDVAVARLQDLLARHEAESRKPVVHLDVHNIFAQRDRLLDQLGRVVVLGRAKLEATTVDPHRHGQFRAAVGSRWSLDVECQAIFSLGSIGRCGDAQSRPCDLAKNSIPNAGLDQGGGG